MLRGILFFLICLIFFSFPQIVAAHEVYVLTPQEVKISLEQTSPNPFNALATSYNQFFLASFLIILVGLSTHYLSRWLTKSFFLVKLESQVKKWAPVLVQLTLSLSILSCVYSSSLFGTELPLVNIFGSLSPLISLLLLLCALSLLIGRFVRLSMLTFILIFICSLVSYPFFTLAYVVYFGEAIVLLVFGPHFGLYIGEKSKESEIEFLVVRVFLGCSLIYSAFFAKFIHSQLALDTITKFQLTRFFPFEPLFVVLGALLIESLIGLCILFGYQIRLISLIFIVFLIVSILFFQESVWPHLVLFGTALTLLFHGYDRYTLRRLITKDSDPIL